jgi:hypothetical protein
VSALTSALDERERRGTLVTQADRLGDTAVNTVGTTTRHNRFNRCAYEAIAAVATGAVLLGDKGDGSPRARAEAVRRNAHYNAGHCPDIIEPDDPDRLYESRVYTPFRAGAGAAGLGSSRCGGKPSCRAGNTHAFGCTREDIRRTALGCAERGVEADGPFDHATGRGYVAPHPGQYADALANGRQVWVLVAEVTSALDSTVAALLRLLGSRAKVKGHRDGTAYGASRMATRDFATHHMRVLSLAIASSIGESIVQHARAVKSDLAAPPTPATLGDFMRSPAHTPPTGA